MSRAFECARPHCGLPVHLKVSDIDPTKWILYHVVQVIQDPAGGPPTRHLRLSGRNGCVSPATLTPGPSWEDYKPPVEWSAKRPRRLIQQPLDCTMCLSGTWTESTVESITTGAVSKAGKGRCIYLPKDWPLGAQVRALLLPEASSTAATAASPTRTTTPTSAPAAAPPATATPPGSKANGHLKHHQETNP